MSRGFLLGSVCGTLGTMTKPVDSQCQTFQTAIQVLGRSWNALILNVLQGGPLRFSELSERAKGPGDKVLSARLKDRSEEHTSELQSRLHLVCRLLLEKKNKCHHTARLATTTTRL